jgi:hypothetical protein
MHACMYVIMYISTRVHYVCIYVPMYVCMYVICRPQPVILICDLANNVMNLKSLVAIVCGAWSLCK